MLKFRWIFLGSSSLGITSAFFNIILGSLLGLTYTNLSSEKVIAQLEFKALEKDIYEATLYNDKGIKIGKYKIYGEQWRMDVAFIKMKYWAVALGADSKYALDRLEGRYKSVHAQNTQKNQAYSLENHQLSKDFSWLVDTTYGSSVYQDIKIDRRYFVYKGLTGLLLREVSLSEESSVWN